MPGRYFYLIITHAAWSFGIGTIMRVIVLLFIPSFRAPSGFGFHSQIKKSEQGNSAQGRAQRRYLDGWR